MQKRLHRTLFKFSLVISVLLTVCDQAIATDAETVAFSELQLAVNKLIKEGKYVSAVPYLEELVKRVDTAGSHAEIEEFNNIISLLGMGYIYLYLESNNTEALVQALKWYDRFERDFPDDPKLSKVLRRKVDIFLALKDFGKAVELIQNLLNNKTQFELTAEENSGLLVLLTRIHFENKAWEEGLPVFNELMETGVNNEDKAWGAAASFEAYSRLNRLDDAMLSVPTLVHESEMRYAYRLNVIILKTSDQMIEESRYLDALILLNLIKTYDQIVEHHKTSIKIKEARINQLMSEQHIEIRSKLKQEITSHQNSLEQLSELPNTDIDYYFRLARTYARAKRNYEAYWLFYSLMSQYNDDIEKIEGITFAAYTSAITIDKLKESIEIAKNYRSRFPDGIYYSEITFRLVNTLKKDGQNDEYLKISRDFVENHPHDQVAGYLLFQWAQYHLDNNQIQLLQEQLNQWLVTLDNAVFKDVLIYFLGLADQSQQNYVEAIAKFKKVLQQYPDRQTAEDSLMQLGVSYVYVRNYDKAKEAFRNYIATYPNGYLIASVYYLLGEAERATKNYNSALESFKRADSLSTRQDMHDKCAFAMGKVYEAQKDFEQLVEHFETYIDRFGNEGRIIDAIYQLGRGYERLNQTVEMLKLYREYIEKYTNDPSNKGVDVLIESYAEKYETNKNLLLETVDFIEQLEHDISFRTQMVTDRGALFEYFFHNPKVDKYLYNRLRIHPKFNEKLVNDLSPISDLTSAYRDQLEKYPIETPEEFFSRLLKQFQAEGDQLATTRMLMGLYRSGRILDPEEPFDRAFLERITPRLILYIADYSRSNNPDLAREAWNALLNKYPSDKAAIVAYTRLSEISVLAEDIEKGIDYLDQLIAQFPGITQLPAIMLRQGELYTLLNQSERAREKYKYILSVSAWRGILHAQALYQIGESYMAEKDYATAHGYFERTFLAYAHFSEWAAKAYLTDAEALLKLNQKQDAISTLTEALKLLPTNTPKEPLDAIKNKLDTLTL